MFKNCDRKYTEVRQFWLQFPQKLEISPVHSGTVLTETFTSHNTCVEKAVTAGTGATFLACILKLSPQRCTWCMHDSSTGCPCLSLEAERWHGECLPFRRITNMCLFQHAELQLCKHADGGAGFLHLHQLLKYYSKLRAHMCSARFSRKGTCPQ